MNCRSCGEVLSHVFIDLGESPPSNSYLSKEDLGQNESFYPLKLFVCEKCWLVQIDEYKSANEIFSEEYAYFSSYSKSWLLHAYKYVEMIVERLSLDAESFVVEVASNDGYLLKNFKHMNIPCLGVEPTLSTAKVAQELGIKTKTEFFGKSLAKKISNEERQADLIIGNNVLAHVPDVNDFVKGLSSLLKHDGVITLEFPHLMRLVENNQFDTIYHEHFSYFSLHAVDILMLSHNMEIFDVEEITTHGGSLRLFVQHNKSGLRTKSGHVEELKSEEVRRGMNEIGYYQNFQQCADKIKNTVLQFLQEQKDKGKVVVGYGAAAKGNTLLNYCLVNSMQISCVVDASPYKQGKYLPGTHIPIVSEEFIKNKKPDYIFILPWNLKEEITYQLSYINDWGGKFFVAIPELEIIAPHSN